MSDSEKIATLLSQVRQLESDCRMKDEALRHEIEITEDAWKRWTEKDQNNPENRGWKLHWSARLAALEQYQKKAALSPTPQPDAAPADDLVKHMVDRFLGWKLPEHFNPDCGIEFDAEAAIKLDPRNRRYEPVGTNLFSADQATEMVRYMLEGFPGLSGKPLKLDIKPEWCLETARREGDAEVGAGFQSLPEAVEALASPLPADDIVARLRLHQIEEGKSFFALWDEAANEIERLRASPLPADDVVLREAAIAKLKDAANNNVLQLHAGELSAQERRTIKAVLGWLMTEIQSLPAANLLRQSAPGVALRCEITGNLSGTDSWAVGYECKCRSCQQMLKTGNTAIASPPADVAGMRERINADHFLLLLHECGIENGAERAAVLIAEYIEGKRLL